MGSSQTVSKFNQNLCERLKRARSDAGYTQEQFAQMLGISVERYRKYENRSPIPVYLIPTVCENLGLDCWFVLTGQGKPPATKTNDMETRRPFPKGA